MDIVFVYVFFGILQILFNTLLVLCGTIRIYSSSICVDRFRSNAK